MPPLPPLDSPLAPALFLQPLQPLKRRSLLVALIVQPVHLLSARQTPEFRERPNAGGTAGGDGRSIGQPGSGLLSACCRCGSAVLPMALPSQRRIACQSAAAIGVHAMHADGANSVVMLSLSSRRSACCGAMELSATACLMQRIPASGACVARYGGK